MSRKIAKLKFRKNGHFRSHSNKNAFAMRRFLWSIKFFKLRQISAECLHLFYVHIYCTPLLGLQIISNRFAQRELGGPVSPYTPPPPPPLPHLSIMGSMQPDTVHCKKFIVFQNHKFKLINFIGFIHLKLEYIFCLLVWLIGLNIHEHRWLTVNKQLPSLYFCYCPFGPIRLNLP